MTFAYNTPKERLREEAERQALAELAELAGDEELGFFPFLIAGIAAAAGAASAAGAAAATITAAVGAVSAAVAGGAKIVEAISNALPKDKKNDVGLRMQVFLQALTTGKLDGRMRTPAGVDDVYKEASTLLPGLVVRPGATGAPMSPEVMFSRAIEERARIAGGFRPPPPPPPPAPRRPPPPPPPPRPMTRPAAPPAPPPPPPPPARVAERDELAMRTRMVEPESAPPSKSPLPWVLGAAAVAAAGGGAFLYLRRKDHHR